MYQRFQFTQTYDHFNKPFKAGSKWHAEDDGSTGYRLYRIPHGNTRWIDKTIMHSLVDLEYVKPVN